MLQALLLCLFLGSLGYKTRQRCTCRHGAQVAVHTVRLAARVAGSASALQGSAAGLCGAPALQRRAGRQRQHCRSRRQAVVALQLENRELLVGDCLGLVCFCVYKQVRLPVVCALRPGRLFSYVHLHVHCARLQ